ncbi:c-type cytochrome [Halomonas nitroreducens]|uniref:Cytochrome c n=1 Tax=Halomonas nitroreducens TaxID=447425 RepID=A0A3S0HV49_9GAMM|nr:cytochrome c [Halomonas nitroreducens]RTR06490.1 cytochrome c [Halomonas nitroreducens]
MFRILAGMALGLVLLAAGAMAYMHSGMYNVAASDDHLPLVDSALHSTMHASVSTRAEDVEVPDLDDPEMIRQGARAYEELCTACHLKPGLDGTVLRAGLNPMPPRLTEPGHRSPAEQFWIIKHGIKMTGMPAWGVTHEDQELWEMVAFLQRLPELSEQDYVASITPEARQDTADDGHDHEHGNMSAMAGEGDSRDDPAPDAAQPRADDGHDHEHGNLLAMADTAGAHRAADDGHHDGAADAPDADDHHKAEAAQQPEDGHHDDGHDHAH